MASMACKNWGFCDLSIGRSFDLKKLYVLEKLGFTTVAINTVVGEPDDEPKKKKRKEQKDREKTDFIPAPLEIPQSVKDTCKLHILQRLTVVFSDTSVFPKVNQSENFNKYDIFAVLPTTLQAFQFTCVNSDADIITFEHDTKLPFKIPRKLYRLAAERGICFELMYSPAIKDSTSRKNIISTAHSFHAVGKSRNIIVTSGSENHAQVRGVHDVINLGFILGLSGNQCVEVIRDNARKLILKAQSRKCGKHFMLVSPLEECTENKIDDS